MWFRKKAIIAHGIIMIVVVGATLVASVLLMTPQAELYANILVQIENG
jgi:hypothetical protein